MNTKLEILKSAEDASVNFIRTGDFPGAAEARYVERGNYFICYLSSQTGCKMACRFCHLTQTGQTALQDVGLDLFLEQANDVLNYYDTADVPRVDTMHFSWMSRGEPLASDFLLHRAPTLLGALAADAEWRGLWPKFKFSTIMPRATMADRDLTAVFRGWCPDVYYSLYSTDAAFRKRWLPKALDYGLALDKLVKWQQASRKIPVLHWASIAGENDSNEDIARIVDAVQRRNLRCDFNLVRYNPFSPKLGEETSPERTAEIAGLLVEASPGCRVKTVSRVGFDVKASCGMFVNSPRLIREP